MARKIEGCPPYLSDARPRHAPAKTARSIRPSVILRYGWSHSLHPHSSGRCGNTKQWLCLGTEPAKPDAEACGWPRLIKARAPAIRHDLIYRLDSACTPRDIGRHSAILASSFRASGRERGNSFAAFTPKTSSRNCGLSE